jgi:hypothetical protein
VCAGLSILLLGWLNGHLPGDALRPQPVAAREPVAPVSAP